MYMWSPEITLCRALLQLKHTEVQSRSGSAMANKFSLAAAAKPSRGTASIDKAQAHRKATAIVVEEGPKPPKFRRRQSTAECIVAIYSYSSDASTVWEGCKDPGKKLWQVQLDHNARNSITIGFYEVFTKFLQQEDDAPDTIQELARKGMIKLVLGDTNDPDRVGFVRWRAAFYIAGDGVEVLHNFLYLLDAFFVFANEGREENVTVSLYPYLGVDIAPIWDDIKYPNYLLYDPERRLPLGIFEAQPPQGKRIMSMTIQPESEIHASFVFHGCTWLFREAWDCHDVRAVTYEEEGTTQYCRAIQNLDVSDELGKAKLLNILDTVLKNLALRVLIEGGLAGLSGKVRSFVLELKSREDLHFA